MFFEKNQLVYVDSQNIQVFPCSRRRALIQGRTNSYLPFDPEARLNTEANNLRHSGLNGFTQSYLKEFDEQTGKLSIVIAGYLFRIDSGEGMSVSTFIENFPEILTAGNRIYANVRLEKIQLFDGFRDYYTWILRDQTDVLETPSAQLDLYKNGSVENPASYYFSGLSFTTEPLYETHEPGAGQKVESICLFENTADGWVINQRALLPDIKHGDRVNSIEVTDLTATYIEQNGKPVASLEVKRVDNEWQLQFTHGQLN